ncbi:MAG: 1-acyl-sn-glycerol-3-phosphate acyltransferase [Clostridia bacterium]|nr:1-acyl-sn-glycerol-3-phosphate acyltransferase [Clostridia bacterium]
MKIKTVNKTYSQVMALPRPKHVKPRRPWILLTALVRILAIVDMLKTRFTYTFTEKKLKGPFLILMNHSSFIDLKIVSRIFFPMPYNIVCTTDGLVGKAWLMRRIGCIPTQKYVMDLTLIRDMKYALQTKKTSVLMYPEAGYSFDGCATTIPDNLGSLLKMLKVPVLMVTTHGAFARDPLYNGLRLRKVKVSADVKCLFNAEQIESLSAESLNEGIKRAFTFDNFAWQYENKIEITEPFRATGLERILYKCCSCHTEGQMRGEGVELVCNACGKRHRMDTLGRLKADDGDTVFEHIPDWYAWERECVREQLLSGEYSLDTPVKIGMLVDHKALYMVGEGRLTHGAEGFVLDGCDGELHYEQKPLSSHSLNSDYFWYEIGDMISIGNRDRLFYCFPTQEGVVTKTRLATEELYKMKLAESRRGKTSRTR